MRMKKEEGIIIIIYIKRELEEELEDDLNNLDFDEDIGPVLEEEEFEQLNSDEKQQILDSNVLIRCKSEEFESEGNNIGQRKQYSYVIKQNQ